MTERRVAHRYDLSSPILVCKSLNPPEFYTAHLRDISTSGVYLFVDGSFAPGSHVELTLSLPLETTRGVQILVRASGTVIRVDGHPKETQPCGVAVIMEHCDIMNPSASVAA